MKKFGNCSKPLIWFMGLLATIFIAGCGSNGGGTQPGVLGISLTDAPACGYDEVNVTVSKVRVHQSDSASDNAAGWTDITLNPARKINLLNLNDPTQPNFALETLGETPLAAGHYTQLRLVLVPNSPSDPFANSVVLSDTKAVEPLVTPSAVQSGIKLIHQFDVGSGQRVDLLLDFDACHSIVRTGNGKYILKPVIKVVPFVLNGIEGFVDKKSFVNESLLGKNVIVSAQLNGEIVRATVANRDTGKFFLAHLDPANDYDVVITADDHETAVIAAVPVESSPIITTVSSSGAPIPLQPSVDPKTRTISGKVTLDQGTDEETAFVTTKQKLDSGPTVTVKSQVATLLSGDPLGDYQYSLTLPIGAPSLGPYAIPLPIVFTQQPAAVAGNYTVQAAATDYVAQSVDNVNISAANQTQDFTLTK